MPSNFASVATVLSITFFIYVQVMAVPQVNKRILDELEVMGFPTVRSIRALHFSGISGSRFCVMLFT
jgi:UBX domain-containing protein 1/4